MSGSLLQRAEHTCDGIRQSQPAVELGFSSCPSLASQLVELGLPVVLGDAPFGIDETLLLHPVQRWIEGALLDAQRILRKLMDPLGDGIPVTGSRAQALEHQQVQSALKEIELSNSHIASTVVSGFSRTVTRVLSLP